MSDLKRDIAAWRRAFERDPIYSDGAIAELEDHLWGLMDEAVAGGATAAEAFLLARDVVGSEPTLRGRFQDAWAERNPVSRWWTRIRSEGRGSSRPRAFLLLRLASLVAGVLGIPFLLTMSPASPVLGLFEWSGGVHFYLQGRSFHAALGLLALFNLFPFGPWRSTMADAARATFTAVVAGMFMRTVRLATGPDFVGQGSDVEAVFWSAVILIGPALWVAQLRWTRPEPELLEPAI